MKKNCVEVSIRLCLLLLILLVQLKAFCAFEVENNFHEMTSTAKIKGFSNPIISQNDDFFSILDDKSTNAVLPNFDSDLNSSEIATSENVRLGMLENCLTIRTNDINNAYLNFLSFWPTQLEQYTCVNEDISPIVFPLIGHVNNVSISGLPSGIDWQINDCNELVISGAPINSGLFDFEVEIQINNEAKIVTGSILVDSKPHAVLLSELESLKQTIPVGHDIMPISFNVEGDLFDVEFEGLPNGINGLRYGNEIQIFGQAQEKGIFPFLIVFKGSKCDTTIHGELIVVSEDTKEKSAMAIPQQGGFEKQAVSADYTMSFTTPCSGSKTFTFYGNNITRSELNYTGTGGWITLVPTYNTTSYTIYVGVTQNPYPTTRRAYINLIRSNSSLSPYVIAVEQAGDNNILTVSPSSLNFNGSGGVSTVNISSTQNWTSSSSASWVSISNATNTAGNSSAQIYCAEGTASSRSANIVFVAGGCYSKTLTINQACIPPTTIAMPNQTICTGEGVKLTATGADTYVWINNTNGNTISPNVSPTTTTTYTVIGSNACGSSSAQTTITVNPKPIVSISTGSNYICEGSSAVLTATGASSYTWNTGASTSSITVTPSTATVYSVTGTTNGCRTSAQTQIVLKPAPTITAVSTPNAVCSGNSVALSASGANTYVWKNSAGTSISTNSSTNVNPSNTTSSPTSTTYYVTGTSTGSGCSKTLPVTITVNPKPALAISGTEMICDNNNLTLTASGASTYVWKNSAGTQIGTSSALNAQPPYSGSTFSVTGINSYGCSNTISKSIVIFPVPVLGGVTPSQSVCQGTSVPLSANGASTLIWKDSNNKTVSSPVSPVSSTTYTVTGTNVYSAPNGSSYQCSSTAQTTINVNSAPNVSITPSKEFICLGDSITLRASGASTYLWSTGATTASIVVNPTTQTTYSVTGTTNGCSSTSQFTVTPRPVPTNISITASPATLCAGQSATLTASGASSYTWSNGSTTASINTPAISSSTTFVVTASANGCSSSKSITLTPKALPVVSIAATESDICQGNSTQLTASGATSYSWDKVLGTASSGSVSPVVSTTYTVTGTTAGCSNTASKLVTVKSKPTVTISATKNPICEGETIALTASGATSYVWNTGSSSSTINVSPQSTQAYTVTGTSSNGCATTTSVTVGVYSRPTFAAYTPDSNPCQNTTTVLSASGNATSYKWLDSGGNTISNSIYAYVSPTTNTTYTVVGSNEIGCSRSESITITPKESPTVWASASKNPICEGETTLLSATGANSYQWTDIYGNVLGSESQLSVTPLAQTTYFVTGTSSNGCVASFGVIVYVKPKPTLQVGISKNPICQGESTTLSASGADSYVWMDDTRAIVSRSNQLQVSPISSEFYQVYGINSNGCSVNSFIGVGVNLSPSVPSKPLVTPQCDQAVLTHEIPPAGELWYWQEIEDGFSTSDNNLNLYVNEERTYYIRARNKSTYCWSPFSTPVVSKFLENSVDPTEIKLINPNPRSKFDSLTVVGGLLGSGAQWVWYKAPIDESSKPIGTGDTIQVYTQEKETYIVRAEGGCNTTEGIEITLDCRTLVQPVSLIASSANSPITSPLDKGSSIDLTIHKGQLIPDANWEWYKDNKLISSTSYEDNDSIYEGITLNRSSRFRARGWWKEKTKTGDFLRDRRTYFVSEKVQVKESLNKTALGNHNYIITYTPTNKDGVTTEDELFNLPIEEQGITIAYFDGLGRPTQTVAVANSFSFNDIYSQVGYDDFGRKTHDYLPAVDIPTSGTSNRGVYRDDFETLSSSFYTGLKENEFNGYKYVQKSNAIETEYEKSPLNRIEKTIDAAGNITSYGYRTNSASEVKLFTVDASGACTLAGTYAAGRLYVTTILPTKAPLVTEYKDIEGHVILKDVGGYSTYYVYDDFGLLRYVLNQKALSSIDGLTSFNKSTDGIVLFGYYYQYDGRKRMVYKQLPGCAPVFMVYDNCDRLVLTQDGNARMNSNKWLYTKYDALNRPVETGFGTTGKSFSELIVDNTFKGLPSDFSILETLTTTKYNPKHLVESTIAKILDGTTSGGTVTRNYLYDSKNRVQNETIVSSDNDKIDQTTSFEYDFTNKVVKTTETYSGKAAATITKEFSYDHAGRLEKVEQTLAEDEHNGKVILAQMDYNELGQMILKKLHCANDTSFTQDIDYAYDYRGWLSKMNNPSLDTSMTNKLFAQDFTYESNGNISHVNWHSNLFNAAKGTFITDNLHSYTYEYDTHMRIEKSTYGEVTPLGESANMGAYNTTYRYNSIGDIEEMTRMGLVSYEGTGEQATPNFGLIDDLEYKYTQAGPGPTEGGQLLLVTDNITSNSTIPHNNHYISKGTANTLYDSNGNAIRMASRGISLIKYNYLNLPQQITLDGGTIQYKYDATGAKLAKLSTSNAYYMGSVLSVNDTLQILNPEGRMLKMKDGEGEEYWAYEYQLRDHLGNTRSSFLADSTWAIPSQFKSYDPFGLELMGSLPAWKDSCNNRFLYNGKELQDDFGLNWYDYGARFYDQALGRFHSVDPEAEERQWLSPYNYCSLNPINRIDPDGMLDDWVERDNQVVWDENVTSATDADLKSGDKYLGKEGYGVNTETGESIHYKSDGTTLEGSFGIGEVTVTGIMSDHARTMSNPVVQAIHQGQEDFSNHPVTKATVSTLLFVATGGIEGAISIASSGSKLLPNIKLLKGKGGEVNGLSISRGGYGAKPRFDVHPLGRASKARNSMPKWTNKRTLPHYHRGAGNNLHRHRPWEKGWNDKSFFDRF